MALPILMALGLLAKGARAAYKINKLIDSLMEAGNILMFLL